MERGNEDDGPDKAGVETDEDMTIDDFWKGERK